MRPADGQKGSQFFYDSDNFDSGLGTVGNVADIGGQRLFRALGIREAGLDSDTRHGRSLHLKITRSREAITAGCDLGPIIDVTIATQRRQEMA